MMLENLYRHWDKLEQFKATKTKSNDVFAPIADSVSKFTEKQLHGVAGGAALVECFKEQVNDIVFGTAGRLLQKGRRNVHDRIASQPFTGRGFQTGPAL